jgi:hypothetical protein
LTFHELSWELTPASMQDTRLEIVMRARSRARASLIGAADRGVAKAVIGQFAKNLETVDRSWRKHQKAVTREGSMGGMHGS